MHQLLDRFLEDVGVYLLVEQEDGKQYIVRGTLNISSTERQLGNQIRTTEPVNFVNVVTTQFIAQKYNVRPKVDGRLCMLEKKDGGGYEAKQEYVTTIVQPIYYKDQLLGYIVYGSDQEVKKYVKS